MPEDGFFPDGFFPDGFYPEGFWPTTSLVTTNPQVPFGTKIVHNAQPAGVIVRNERVPRIYRKDFIPRIYK